MRHHCTESSAAVRAVQRTHGYACAPDGASSRSRLPDESKKFDLAKRFGSILPRIRGLRAARADTNDQKIRVAGHAFRDPASLLDDRILGLIAGQAIEFAGEGKGLSFQAMALAL